MKKILSALLAAVVVSTLHSAYADTAAQEYNFAIARQPLEATLKEFSKQTGLNTAFVRKTRNQRDVIVGPLKGRYTAAEALSTLLENTGLTFRRTNDLSISVTTRDAVKSPRDGARMTKTVKEAKFLHFAKSQFSDEEIDEVGVQRIAAMERSGEIPTHKEASKDRWIDEVVVAGSHIRGVENNTVPVTVLDKAYIDSTGLSTTTRLIESLPQNFALTSQSAVQIPGTTAAVHQGSSVNLRGVGQGTTLVLLNGRRLAPGYDSTAVDISALPLSAIERVEILTDGASALYGSDAVGGVVNFVLRDDFEGAETRLRSGWADAINEYGVSQVLGSTWNSGNALVSLEYYKRDLLSAKDRDFVPSASLIGSLLPRDKNYSAMVSGQQDLSERLSVFADALYTKRESHNLGGRTTSNQKFDVDASQVTATLGTDWRIGGDWRVEAAGSYARNRMILESRNTIRSRVVDPLFEIRAGQVKADGSVWSLPGGKVSLAIGAEWRAESFNYSTVDLLSGSRLAEGIDSNQIVRSAFAQAYVPIVGARNAMTVAKRLELSLAARFDDYSSFGSSFDPQVGIMWEPVAGLRLRASRGSSYKAPNLAEYNLSSNSASALFLADPGAPGGRSYQLLFRGTDVDSLSPQDSKNSSFGLEFVPEFLHGLQLGLNYYKIEYTGRIAPPASGSSAVMLNNPVAYGSLIYRSPSAAQVNEAIALAQLGTGFTARNADLTLNTNFTPASVDVLVDLRTRNLSVTTTSGLDISAQYNFSVMGGGVQLGLSATHIYDLTQQVTSTSAPFDTVNTIYNPPNWRARSSVGWQYQSWAANLFVNHTDSYVDNRSTTLVSISSHTTMDARLAYDFGHRLANSFWSGLTVSVNAQNLFDSDPPPTRVTIGGFDMGFDPTNASPLGRFIAVEVSKAW